MTTSRLVRFSCALVLAAAGAACSSSAGDAADAGASPPWASDGTASSPDGGSVACGAFPRDYSAGSGSVTYYTLGALTSIPAWRPA